ncbi:MAG: SGNH/GDSL hydrolase family protein, partial [Rikenellaceae bacterium]
MKKQLLSLAALSLLVMSAAAKQLTDEQLISLSQADAGKERVFAPDKNNTKDIDVAGYSNPAEFNVRRGAPNFLRKCAEGRDVKVSFIGGSITNGPYQHRNQVANYLASMYPNVKMTGINAGIGGSGADLGAARLAKDLLKYDPDLLFIEYAVNGSDEKGVEGIIRQAIKHNPEIDICLTYTLSRGQAEQYGAGEVPANIKKLDKVAAHYNIPSVHMGLWAGELQRDGKLVWASKKPVAGKIVFSGDGVHPKTEGGNLYGAAVARAFEAMNRMPKSSKPVKMELGKKLSPDAYDRGQYISPVELAKGKKGWSSVRYIDAYKDPKYADWFENVTTGDKNSEPIEFKFEGNLLGLYDITGPDGCGIDIYLNGKKLVATETRTNGKVIKSAIVDGDDPRISTCRFNEFCGGLNPRPQYVIFKLPQAMYDVKICVSPEKLDKLKLLKDEKRTSLSKEYDPQLAHLCWIVL